MYQEYFRLTAAPFSIAPDPRFLYMSARHREAMAHLLYGVRGDGGFVLLTGEIGTGKTTICRCLLEQIPEQCDVAFVLNPKLGVRDLLATICDEFHVQLPPGGGSIKHLVDAINQHLLRAHAASRRAILIIDEAQNLQPQVLELLRLLTNLETNTRKLLQIILIGQPELQDLLARPEMRQVAQRVVARFHLGRLTRAEVAAYVKHRLSVAGTRSPLIPDRLMRRLYRLTDGVPRLINLICDRALLGVYVTGRQQATAAILRRAADEVFGDASAAAGRQFGLRYAWLGAACIILVGLSLYLLRGADSLAGVASPALAAGAEPSANAIPAAPMPPPAESAPPPSAGDGEPAGADLVPVAAGKLYWPDSIGPRALSEKIAFRDLLSLYGFDYQPAAAQAPCQAAAVRRLRCFAGRGGLADLRRFNQPAVLALDSGGGRFHAVLTGIDGDSGLFVLDGETRRVALADISTAWSGDYVLVWQVPPGVKDTLSPGSRGQAVVWLRRSLAAVAGDDRDADGPARFDDELVKRVKAFQMAEGILPDGVVGALTIARLDMRLDKALPRLDATAEPSRNVLHP